MKYITLILVSLLVGCGADDKSTQQQEEKEVIEPVVEYSSAYEYSIEGGVLNVKSDNHGQGFADSLIFTAISMRADSVVIGWTTEGYAGEVERLFGLSNDYGISIVIKGECESDCAAMALIGGLSYMPNTNLLFNKLNDSELASQVCDTYSDYCDYVSGDLSYAASPSTLPQLGFESSVALSEYFITVEY